MRPTRIPLTDSEALIVERGATSTSVGIERVNVPEGLGGIESVYVLNESQRAQLREALR